MNIFCKTFCKKNKEEVKPPLKVNKMNRPPRWQAKEYVLIKDMPNLNKGTRFYQSYLSDSIYFAAIPISGDIDEDDQVGIVNIEAKDVENNTEWFEKLDL